MPLSPNVLVAGVITISTPSLLRRSHPICKVWGTVDSSAEYRLVGEAPLLNDDFRQYSPSLFLSLLSRFRKSRH